jgi:hypothetical protein
VPSRAIFRENLPNGGRGSGCALKKGGGHTISLRTIALSATGDHIRSFISSTLADRYQMINCSGFKPAVMASVVISLQHLESCLLIIGGVVASAQCQPLVSKCSSALQASAYLCLIYLICALICFLGLRVPYHLERICPKP